MRHRHLQWFAPSGHYRRQGTFCIFQAGTTGHGVVANVSADRLGKVSLTSAATA